MRTLIPILALTCLLVGGCMQEIDRDELRSALRDLEYENRIDSLDWAWPLDDPCPPCPDTVYLKPKPTGWWIPVGVWTSCRSESDTTIWSHSGYFYFYDKRLWPCPDSVFVLDLKPGEE